MLVMAGRGHAMIHYWAGKLPNSVGQIYSPSKAFPTFPWLEYAIDNGKYAAHAAGRDWDAQEFLEFAKQARYLPKQPLWVVVPDAIYDAQGTLELWAEWEPQLRRLGFRLAFAAQDGLSPQQVPASADVVFMGGSDAWKFTNLPHFVSLGKPIHVGRVNGNRLWQCYRAGVTSCDGSGWFRGDQQQLAKLESFLRFRARELGIPAQLDLTAQYFDRGPRIPSNIDQEHLLQAMATWWECHHRNRPQRYAVQHNGRLYPVKLLIARANLYANGHCLNPRSFSGGDEANRFVESRGLKVVKLKK